MSNKNHTKVYKKHTIQRSDTTLTKDIATALVELVLKGAQPFGRKTKYLEITVGGEVKKINKSVINNWYYRNNVIPETGELFRDFLNLAREEYRKKQREAKQVMMLKESEQVLHKTIRMKTKNVIMTKSGTTFEREDAKLVKVKTDVAMFLTERLDPNRYGQKSESKNTMLMLSFADLREAEDRMNEKRNE